MSVLITAAATSQAYQLERVLNINEPVCFADSVELPAVLLKDKKFVKIPAGNSFSFAHQLLAICLDLGISKVFPLRRAEVTALAEARLLFDEYGILIIVPPLALINGLLGNRLNGQVVVNEEEGSSATLPARGVFIVSSESKYQLFTAD